MRVVVTGGAGFIGSHLCEALLRDGSTVDVVDCFDDYYDPAEKRANAARLTGLGARIHEFDIREQTRLSSVLTEVCPDAVVHLAARAGVRPSIADPALYVAVNVEGTQCVLEASRLAGVRRFIFGSSSSVYGELRTPPFSESASLLRPISPYAATKLAGEAMAHVYHHLYAMEVACLRFFTVYGPRQRPDLAIRQFAERIRAGRKIVLFGDGSTRRDYTWVEDIVRGVCQSLVVPIGYEVINLGGGETTTLKELVGHIERAVGREAVVEWAPDQPGDVPLTCADNSKAERLLRYRPQMRIAQGIPEFVKWLQRAVPQEAQ